MRKWSMTNGSRPLPNFVVLNFLEQLCYGLLHAHACLIAHLDMKFDNALLDGSIPSSGDERLPLIKIGDWGLSRKLSSPFEHAANWKYSAHEAPELSQGVVGLSADMWSLGRMLYKLLKGGSFRPERNVDVSALDLSEM
ncbi:hypothetical protein WJX73_006851 [Symbiochloris irregularis]|uniref:Protein kinase domain-containing protein n=1 Tax=Symbiochloris irregularis TaxID=706552 RepID=A0AAW1PXN8_9CHLO